MDRLQWKVPAFKLWINDYKYNHFKISKVSKVKSVLLADVITAMRKHVSSTFLFRVTGKLILTAFLGSLINNDLVIKSNRCLSYKCHNFP